MRRLALRFTALGYLALLLGLPVGFVFYRAFEHGIGTLWSSITTPEAGRPPPPVPLPQKLGEGELRRGAGEASLALGPGGGGLREGLLLETLIQRRSAARSWGRGYQGDRRAGDCSV